MPTYLYCVRTEAIDPPAGLTGIDGGIVRPIDVGGLRAWVSDVDASVAPTIERVKAHDAVCAAALRARDTPLPIRFGQTFADDAAAVLAVDSRERTLRSRLARVDGCVELRVVMTRGRSPRESHTAGITPESGPTSESDREAPSMGPGTAFLQRLAAEGRADLDREVGCEDVRHRVRAAGEALLADVQPCESARGVSFFPVLVRRSDVSAFRDLMAGIVGPEAIDLSVLGPFVPYSFAGDA